MKEATIIKKLSIMAMGFPPFKVELKDFGSSPSHSIYINVTSRLTIEKLVKAVKTDTKALMKLNQDTKPHFFQDPHVAVAMKLKPSQYEKAWLEYSQKHSNGKFIADEKLLLTRLPEEKSCQIAGRFEFQNLPVSVTQGILFS